MGVRTTSFIIFGVTGDLARQKLIPSLYKLFVRGLLPEGFILTGYGRKVFAEEEFVQFIEDCIRRVELPADKKEYSVSYIKQFCSRVYYVQGQLDHGADYERLSAHIAQIQAGESYMYLSVPPSFHLEIVHQLGCVGLLTRTEGYTPFVMIEKPFGENEASAKEFDYFLSKYLADEHIYRVDHYLGKEALQRFDQEKLSSLFSRFWNSTYIERIEACIYEQKDVGTRGAFYDTVGALADVGQNHLLQMLVAVMIPSSFGVSYREVSALRSKAMSSFDVVAKSLIRGQYKGFRHIQGVSPDSLTETYFKAELKSSLPQWTGTRFALSAGKAMKNSTASLTITFKNPSGRARKKNLPNPLVIELNARRNSFDGMDAYEHVLHAAFQKNHTLFISTQEAVAGWKLVKRIRNAWKKYKVPMMEYVPGRRL